MTSQVSGGIPHDVDSSFGQLTVAHAHDLFTVHQPERPTISQQFRLALATSWPVAPSFPMDTDDIGYVCDIGDIGDVVHRDVPRVAIPQPGAGATPAWVVIAVVSTTAAPEADAYGSDPSWFGWYRNRIFALILPDSELVSAHCLAPFSCGSRRPLRGLVRPFHGSGRCLRRSRMDPFSKADFREVASERQVQIEIN